MMQKKDSVHSQHYMTSFINSFLETCNFPDNSKPQPAKIKNLVFEGGGVKGAAYLGALKALESLGFISLNEIERVGGTSAGAITALLLGLGYNLAEIEAHLNRSFKDFLDGNEEIKTFLLDSDKIIDKSLFGKTVGDILLNKKGVLTFLEEILNLSGSNPKLEKMKLDDPKLLSALGDLYKKELNLEFPMLNAIMKELEDSMYYTKWGVPASFVLALLSFGVGVQAYHTQPSLGGFISAISTVFGGGVAAHDAVRHWMYYSPIITILAIFAAITNYAPLAYSAYKLYEFNSLASEIKAIIDHFMKSDIGIVTYKIINTLQAELGLFQGKVLEEWFKEFIKGKGLNENITFAELHVLKEKGKPFKDIYFTGVNIATQLTEVFSYEDTPNMPIANAVRISMSIPFLFVPQRRYEHVNGIIKPINSPALYVDGGVNDNYPMWLFDKPHYLKKGQAYNEESLGFKLLPFEEAERHSKNQTAPSVPIKNFFEFAKAFLSNFYNKQESDHNLHAKDKVRTIYINTLDVQTTDFGLDHVTKRNLENSGYRAANEYVNKIKENSFNLQGTCAGPAGCNEFISDKSSPIQPVVDELSIKKNIRLSSKRSSEPYSNFPKNIPEPSYQSSLNEQLPLIQWGLHYFGKWLPWNKERELIHKEIYELHQLQTKIIYFQQKLAYLNKGLIRKSGLFNDKLNWIGYRIQSTKNILADISKSSRTTTAQFEEIVSQIERIESILKSLSQHQETLHEWGEETKALLSEGKCLRAVYNDMNDVLKKEVIELPKEEKLDGNLCSLSDMVNPIPKETPSDFATMQQFWKSEYNIQQTTSNKLPMAEHNQRHLVVRN